MNQMNSKRRTELGLLAVLVSVADTGSVSAAAKRLSVSQPAVSHALKRLRDIVGDHLFQKEGRRMLPTPVAVSMIEEARRVINAADTLLRPRSFDPRIGTPSWIIGMSDYVLAAVGRPLVNRLKSINPSARLTFVPIGPQTLEDLLSGRIDLAFWGDLSDQRIAPPIVVDELFSDHYIGVMCRSHPLAGAAKRNTITLDDWLNCGHVRFTTGTQGSSTIDRELVRLGRTRNFSHASPSYMLNLEFIRKSRLLLSLPSRLKNVVNIKEFVIFYIPLVLPFYPYFLLHNSNFSSDPMIYYIKNIIADIVDK